MKKNMIAATLAVAMLGTFTGTAMAASNQEPRTASAQQTHAVKTIVDNAMTRTVQVDSMTFSYDKLTRQLAVTAGGKTTTLAMNAQPGATTQAIAPEEGYTRIDHVSSPLFGYTYEAWFCDQYAPNPDWYEYKVMSERGWIYYVVDSLNQYKDLIPMFKEFRTLVQTLNDKTAQLGATAAAALMTAFVSALSAPATATLSFWIGVATAIGLSVTAAYQAYQVFQALYNCEMKLNEITAAIIAKG